MKTFLDLRSGITVLYGSHGSIHNDNIFDENVVVRDAVV
jgi:hypothetical protein